MNLYVFTISNVIEYIEKNISKPLTPREISGEFFLSEFHFSRLFKMVIGISMKQYITGRKFAVAVELLKNTDKSIGDIALELGFEYPEVFSRAFKKQFGVSPSFCRKGMAVFDIIPKARIVERDIANFGGVLTLREDYIYLDSFNLYGHYFEVNENKGDFSDSLKKAGERALHGLSGYDSFYSVVNCHGDESGRYTVFFGKKGSAPSGISIRNIPAGWYARFKYHGDMLDMRTTFNNDFLRWMLVKEIEPCSNGIGMINVYDGCDLRNVQILIPVKEAKTASIIMEKSSAES